EVGTAIADLAGRRLIPGRGAMAGGGDVGPVELHAVVARIAGGLRRKSRAVQHAVEDVAGTVASEHAAGAVGPMGSRREPQNQDPRARVAERRHGLSPVFPVEVSSALGSGDAGGIFSEPRTETAGHDPGLKDM